MKNSEEPAFPVIKTAATNQSLSGLTKREYFAGLAMQGILSSINKWIDRDGKQLKADDVAELAISASDRLLEQLEENKIGRK